MITLTPNRKVGADNVDTNTEYLDSMKDIKKAFFKERCEADICKGFTSYNGHFYRTNRDDQTNMIGQKSELEDDASITTVYWKTEDAGYVPHTRDEWVTVYIEAFKHKKDILFKYDAKKQEVFNATTELELSEITW